MFFSKKNTNVFFKLHHYKWLAFSLSNKPLLQCACHVPPPQALTLAHTRQSLSLPQPVSLSAPNPGTWVQRLLPTAWSAGGLGMALAVTSSRCMAVLSCDSVRGEFSGMAIETHLWYHTRKRMVSFWDTNCIQHLCKSCIALPNSNPFCIECISHDSEGRQI